MKKKVPKKGPKSPRSRRPGRYAFVIEFHEPDLSRARQIAAVDQRSLAYIVRRALHFWLQTPDAAMMAVPLAERMHASTEHIASRTAQ